MVRGVIRDSVAWMWQGAKVQCPGLPIPARWHRAGRAASGQGKQGWAKPNKKKAGTSPAAGKEGLGKQGGRKGRTL